MVEIRRRIMEAKKKNENFSINFDKLDDSQFVAVNALQDNVVVRAPAGSGKTATTITAIAAYRYEHPEDRICAITYTRAARAEMEVRLQEMGIFDVEVTTIHVWSRNILLDLSQKYDFKVQILEEPRIKMILEDLVAEYIKRHRIKSVNIGILYTYITGSKQMDISDGYRKTLNALEDRYVKYKRDNMLYDFTDYPLYLYDVMNIYNERISTIDALFVDEFQDVDPVQFEIFEKVDCAKKFYVGDSWQSIFQFRGADGEVFNKAKSFAQYKLEYNYRSYQEIVDYAVTVYKTLKRALDNGYDGYISQVLKSVPSNIVCYRGAGGRVDVVSPFGAIYSTSQSKKLDITQIFNEIMTMNPMILCRTNKQVKRIQELGYYQVSTVHQAKGLEYDAVIVADCAIEDLESLNVAYVALTRAKDRMMVISWPQLETLMDNRQKTTRKNII